MTGQAAIYDVVGPICESSDIFSRNVSGQIPSAILSPSPQGPGNVNGIKIQYARIAAEIMTSPRHINVISPRHTEDILSHETILNG